MEGKIVISLSGESTHRSITIECNEIAMRRIDAFIILKHLLESLEFNQRDRAILALALATGHWPQDDHVTEQKISLDTDAINKAKENLK